MSGGDRQPQQSAHAQRERQREYDEQQARLEDRAGHIRHQVLVLSGKGGVGKSMFAVNLAFGLAKRGLAVGLLDADLHGPSISLMTGLVGRRALGGQEGILPIAVLPNLFVMSMGLLLDDDTAPVIWRGPIRANVIRQFIADVEWPDLDCLVVDLPPGTGDEPLTVAQALPGADGAIVVTTPQEASLYDCRRAVRFVEKVGLPVLGVVENMSGLTCPHCGRTIPVFSSGGGQEMAEQMGVPFLGRVPLAPELAVAGDAGKSAFSDGVPEPVRNAVLAVVDGVRERLGVT